jgi:hypothetical protein
VLGTLMLGLLAGHRRYAHITALRGDAVAAQALGMNKVVSEDALRRALERIDEAASAAWMRPSLMHSVREALDRPWVLDIDASIKPLYGRQEGAEIGYNPSKPMRPSHVLHTFLVSNLRLVLDVQVSSGKQHTSGHAKAALGRLLDELGDKRPALVRGRLGLRQRGHPADAGERKQPYLLRLRQTKNVQRLVAQQFARQDWSRPDNQGCQMVEASCNCTAGASQAPRGHRAPAHPRAASRASGAWTASNCGWTWRARACTRATSCGSTRCWSPTWPTRWSRSGSSTATAPMRRTPSTS